MKKNKKKSEAWKRKKEEKNKEKIEKSLVK